ncbi:hypothetical protein [Caballeronia grimmiae]|uniref:hypothetical protein n=1 Tax=Caballeronia grimmiae TaxID=1071679 RepID=UPI0038BE08D5
MGKPVRWVTPRLLFLSFKRVLCLALLATSSMTAHAQSTDCGHPDPTNFDQVFACMSSLHFGAQGQGPNGPALPAAAPLRTNTLRRCENPVFRRKKSPTSSPRATCWRRAWRS